MTDHLETLKVALDFVNSQPCRCMSIAQLGERDYCDRCSAIRAIKQADAAIALMRGQSWQDIASIPDTGKPEFPFGVLVSDDKGRVFTAHCSRHTDGDFYVYSGQFRITGATHWQPLPAPPKDSADEQ